MSTTQPTTVEEATAALVGILPQENKTARSSNSMAMFIDRNLQQALPANKYDEVYKGIYLGDQ